MLNRRAPRILWPTPTCLPNVNWAQAFKTRADAHQKYRMTISLPSFEVKIMMTSNKNKALSKKTIDKNTDQFYENRQKTHYFSEFA